METKIKKRKAFYCNIKVLLLFLVIYGHLIEPRIGNNDFFLWQYRFIYAVHMPMFAFLSGMFLKSEYDCLKQMRSALKFYVPSQLIAMLFFWITENRVISFFTPYWHLWYLLSLFFWAAICYFAARIRKTQIKAALLLLSVVIACLCGYVDGIGRFLSLSRTLCFLPFVLLGCFLPKETDFAKYRRKGFVIGLAATLLCFVVLPNLPVEALYFADSYQKLEVAFGAGVRALCMLLAFGIGTGLLCLMPRRNLSVSKVGVDTLWVYLLHGPIVKVVRTTEMSDAWFVLLAPALAALIYFSLYQIFGRREETVRIVP